MNNEPTLDDLIKQHRSIGAALRAYALRNKQTAVRDRKTPPTPPKAPPTRTKPAARRPPKSAAQQRRPVPPQLKRFVFQKKPGGK